MTNCYDYTAWANSAPTLTTFGSNDYVNSLAPRPEVKKITVKSSLNHRHSIPAPPDTATDAEPDFEPLIHRVIFDPDTDTLKSLGYVPASSVYPVRTRSVKTDELK